jgi:hypothetical protein
MLQDKNLHLLTNRVNFCIHLIGKGSTSVSFMKFPLCDAYRRIVTPGKIKPSLENCEILVQDIKGKGTKFV